MAKNKESRLFELIDFPLAHGQKEVEKLDKSIKNDSKGSTRLRAINAPIVDLPRSQ